MRKFLSITLILLLVSTAASAVQPTALLVHVTELSAIGPDGQSRVLYRDQVGVLTSYRDLGQAAYHVRGAALPDGGYHTLSVTMADGATLLAGDGRRIPTSLTAQGIEHRRRIGGMLWVHAGDVQPLRVDRPGVRARTGEE